MFREPGKPGRVKPKLFIAVSGFENRFGPAALALRVTLEFIEEVSVPAVVRKKFVGKLKPLLGLNGKPDRQRAVSVTSQSPTSAFTIPPPFDSHLCPCPKGKSITAKPLKLCVKSKSETARFRRRSNGFCIRPCTVQDRKSTRLNSSHITI